MENTIPIQGSQKRVGESRNLKLLISSVLVLILISVIAFFAWQFISEDQDSISSSANGLEENQTEANRIIEQLSVIYLIDEGYNPTVARIENVDELKASNPNFYDRASNGDYLILYQSEAIIFRDSTLQIVEIAPILRNE